jgi:beta-lactamase superfamily II metal-dependent hydrolase
VGTAPALSAALLKPEQPLTFAVGDLALFVLNVGDGDSLVLRFPNPSGTPQFGVVDCFDAPKTIALLHDLGAQSLRFVAATHPHYDHVKGLKAVLAAFDGNVAEFWDSGFRFTSATYKGVIEEVERQGIRFIRPTSGYEAYVGRTQVAVLSPSIFLRNRYDTYGVDPNNASIVLRISYPEHPPSTDYPKPSDATPGPTTSLPTRRLILGGDAQTDAWGHVLAEFPHFRKDEDAWAQQISARTGRQPLACDLFKVSHHCSKRGINLELIERLGDTDGEGPSDGPKVMVVSSGTGGDSEYGFPHGVTQELLREVRDPRAQSGGAHPADGKLGIHYTAQALSGGGKAGSVVYVVTSTGIRRLYRLGDGVDDQVSLARARRVG